MHDWLVVINENMYDAGVRVVHADQAYPLSGWERVWSAHESEAAARDALAEAREAVRALRGEE